MATLSVLNYNNLTVGLNIKMSSISNENQNLANVTGLTAQGERRLLNKTFNKITVQNVLSENHESSLNITNSNPNAIVRKIKDFGMIGTVNNACGAVSLNMNSRKRPLVETKQTNQKPLDTKTLTATSSKKPKLSKEERAAIRLAKKQAKENLNNTKLATKPSLALLPTTKVPGTPGRKGLPLPQAVARRNARERNRVKQVNNGFAALRERIPEEVAEVFENQGPNRGSGKKLSKVETLRMAVEYIRSLERLLGFNFPVGNSQLNASSGEDSFSLIKDEFDSYSPSMDEHFDDSMSHYDNEEFFNSSNINNNSIQQTAIPLNNNSSPLHAAELQQQQQQQQQQMDMLPNITTLNGLQYIRIPGTNTYQLLTPDIFVGTAASPPSSTIDEEQFNALIDTNCKSPASLTSSSSSSSPTTAIQVSTPSPSFSLSSGAINAIEVTKETTAPVVATNKETLNKVTNTQTTATTTLSSSSSPVLQNEQQQQQQPLLLSPHTSSQQLQQQQHQQQHLPTLSPASTNDQLLQPGLSLTCATNQQRSQFLLTNASDQQHHLGTSLHMIKQEYEEPSVLYQQQQEFYHTAMSPPIDRNTPSTSALSSSSSSSHILPSLFSNDRNSASFYEGVVTLKKEFDNVLLDAAAHGTNVLSDESMIDAIDWWDAHTPKSEGGNIMM